MSWKKSKKKKRAEQRAAKIVAHGQRHQRAAEVREARRRRIYGPDLYDSVVKVFGTNMFDRMEGQ